MKSTLVVVLMLLCGLGTRAQSFTLNPNGVLSPPTFTYYVEEVNGQTSSGTVVHHDDSGLWDFNLPTLTLIDCTESSSVVIKSNASNKGYTSTITLGYTCTGYSVQTVQVINYVYVGCGRSRCVTEVLPLEPISGTITRS